MKLGPFSGVRALPTIVSLLMAVMLSIAWLQDLAEAQDPTDQTRSMDLSKDRLARSKYSRRQQATLQMWRDRDLSREQVQEAARHPDPEVAGRAKWILRQWRRGSLPDTPPEVFRLLQQANGPAAVERLLEGGQFVAAVVAVEESAGTADREAIQKRISSALLRRFPIYVHHALANQSLPHLLKLIDMVADSKELAVCRIHLMREMGIEFDADSLLPRSASTWSAIQRQRATALVLLTLGRIDDAIQVARAEDSDNELLRQCRMIGARWQEEAEENLESARLTEAGSYEHARTWALTLIAADRAGDDELFETAVNQLSAVETPERGDLASELRWRSLASHGRVDAALKILGKTNPDIAASVSIDGARAAEAFDLLDYPLDRVDLNIANWVDDAIQAQRAAPANELSPEINRLLALMQCLIAVGYDQPAWYIAQRVCDSDVKVGSFRLRIVVLSSLVQTRHADWVVKLALGQDETVLTPKSQEMITLTLDDTDDAAFELILRALASMMRGKPIRQRLDAAYQLVNGQIPSGFDPDVDFRRLFQYVTRPRAMQRAGQIGFHGIRANLSIVNLFTRHGQVDLANDCLRMLVQTGDAKALFQLAEHELDGGRSDEAQRLFESVYRRVESQGRGAGRLGTSDDAALAVKALIGLWTIARRHGDQETSVELEREIRLSLCTPSMNTRNAVAEYLGERGDTRLALQAFELSLPMAVLGSPERTGLYDVARGYSMIARKTNVAEAARWFDLAVGGTLESMNFRPRAYLTLPLYVRRWAIEASIQQSDVDQTRDHLDRILQLDPMDIDFAERLLPEMRKAGMGELADQALDRILDAGINYTREFPFDAMAANNLAWVAAMNQKRLDDALQLSRMAVYLEPDSFVYRDTLAEVLFQLGRTQEALQVEQACLLDQPDDWHLHQQISKFQLR